MKAVFLSKIFFAINHTRNRLIKPNKAVMKYGIIKEVPKRLTISIGSVLKLVTKRSRKTTALKSKIGKRLSIKI
jgi:hypothetical protein